MTEHEKLVARVARAIDPEAWDKIGMTMIIDHRERQRHSKRMAHAAIAEVHASLKEPTLEMVQACLTNAGISPAEADYHPLAIKAVRRQFAAAIAASPLNEDKAGE